MRVCDGQGGDRGTTRNNQHYMMLFFDTTSYGCIFNKFKTYYHIIDDLINISCQLQLNMIFKRDSVSYLFTFI